MGARGPAPKPTALRVLHGDQNSRIPKGEPVPDAAPIVAPDDLDADALAVWKRLAPDLIRKGVLTHWDTEALAIYCQAVAYNHEARVIASGTGVIVPGRNGNAVKNPALQVFRDTAELALRAGSRFGLTPSDRAQLATGDDTPMDGDHLLTR